MNEPSFGMPWECSFALKEFRMKTAGRARFTVVELPVDPPLGRFSIPAIDAD